MNSIRWGIIGCRDVTEVKSGPGFAKAEGSALVAVMRRTAHLTDVAVYFTQVGPDGPQDVVVTGGRT